MVADDSPAQALSGKRRDKAAGLTEGRGVLPDEEDMVAMVTRGSFYTEVVGSPREEIADVAHEAILPESAGDQG